MQRISYRWAEYISASPSLHNYYCVDLTLCVLIFNTVPHLIVHPSYNTLGCSNEEAAIAADQRNYVLHTVTNLATTVLSVEQHSKRPQKVGWHNVISGGSLHRCVRSVSGRQTICAPLMLRSNDYASIGNMMPQSQQQQQLTNESPAIRQLCVFVCAFISTVHLAIARCYGYLDSILGQPAIRVVFDGFWAVFFYVIPFLSCWWNKMANSSD